MNSRLSMPIAICPAPGGTMLLQFGDGITHQTARLALKRGRPPRRLSGVLLPRLQSGGAAVHDPSVWTGRALQAENDDLENVGLALLYSAC